MNTEQVDSHGSAAAFTFAFLVLDRHNRVIFANQKAGALFGTDCRSAVDALISEITAFRSGGPAETTFEKDIPLPAAGSRCRVTLQRGTAPDSILTIVVPAVVSRLVSSLQSILNVTSDAALIDSADHAVLDCNSAAAALLGYASKDELIGTSSLALIAEKDRPRLLQNAGRLLDGSYTGGNIYNLRTRDGHEVPVEFASAVFRDGQGTACFVVVIKEPWNIRQLAPGREQHSALIAEADSAAVLVDPVTGAIVDANPAACGYYGYAREELRSMRMQDIIILAPEQILCRIAEALTGPDRVFCFQHRLASREVRDVEMFCVPVFANGQQYLQTFIHDITAQKQAEAQTAAARDFYKKLLDEFPMPVWMTGIDLKCTYFNKALLAFTGRTLEQEIAVGWDSAFHPDDVELCRAIFADANAKRMPFALEHRVRRFDGVWRWLYDTGRPYYDPDGAFAGYVGACLDVTERRHYEEGLNRLNGLFLKFVPSPAENIRRLVAVCGELMNAAGAMYCRCTNKGPERVASWDSAATPALCTQIDDAVCRAVLKEGCGVTVIGDVAQAGFLSAGGPAAAAGPLQCLGVPVQRAGQPEGVLCIFSRRSEVPTEEDQKLLAVIAAALGGEESRRQEQEIATRQREYLESVTENVDAGMAIIGKDYRVLWMNRVMHQLFGSVEGMKCHCAFHGGDAVCSECGASEIFGGKTDKAVHERFAHDDQGNPLWVQLIVTPIRNAAGETVAAMELAVLITERKKMEELLREKEEKYRLVVENVNMGFTLVDADFTIRKVNKTMCDAAGRTEEELIGKKCHRALKHSEEPCADCLAGEVIAARRTMERDEEVAYHDGSRHILHIRLCPIINDDGVVTGFVHTGEDVTERRHMEREREHLHLQLVQSEKLASLGTLAGGIAHEFNNLLHIMRGNAEGGLRLTRADDMKEFFRDIVTVTERAEKIIKDMLCFAQPYAPEKETTGIAGLIEWVLMLTRAECRKHRISFVRRYEHIPPLRVNRSELQQVLLNLLINARDAMPGAGGEIKIELARTDSGIRIVFSDTGEGIPAEHLGKVFDPFFTTRQARSDGGRAGTGLGLYVTYWIVKRHGGSIDVQSVVGRGTTFTINLPLQETAGSEAGGTGIQRVRP